jgi:hypothetical protein
MATADVCSAVHTEHKSKQDTRHYEIFTAICGAFHFLAFRDNISREHRIWSLICKQEVELHVLGDTIHGVTSWSLYSWGKKVQYPLGRRLGGPLNRYGGGGGEESYP